MAWVYCLGLASAFMLFLQYIAPIWLMPLFNHFTPLPEGPLRQAILTCMNTLQIPLANIFVMDGSRRTTKTNAFVTGFGHHRRIVLFDTMIQNHTVPEVVAVLVHELGHFKNRHILKMTTIALIYLAILCWVLGLSMHLPELHHAFYMDRVTLHGGLIFFILLAVPLDLLLGPCLKWLSRHYEDEADAFAAKNLPDPQPLIAALKKVTLDHLSNLTPHPLHVILHHSHPPLLHRIRAIERLKKGQEK